MTYFTTKNGVIASQSTKETKIIPQMQINPSGLKAPNR